MDSKKLSEENFKKLLNSIATNQLKGSPYLKEDELNLSGLGLGDDDVKKIMEALKRNDDISELNLDNNNISDEGGKTIAEFLKNNFITGVSLKNNKIRDEGAKSIANALKYNNGLIDLALDYNKIGDEGAKAFLSVLQKNCLILSELSLLYNNISPKCIIDIRNSPGGEIFELDYNIW